MCEKCTKKVYENCVRKSVRKRTRTFFPGCTKCCTNFFPLILIGFYRQKHGEVFPFKNRSLSVQTGKICIFKFRSRFFSAGEVSPFTFRSPSVTVGEVSTSPSVQSGKFLRSPLGEVFPAHHFLTFGQPMCRGG